MGLQIKVENLDSVEERYRDLYSKQGEGYVLTGVDGLKSQEDIDKLQGALSKERTAHNELKGRVKLLGDKKIEDVLQQLDRIPELEASAKNADTENVNELVSAKLRTALAPVERERDNFKSKVDELMQRVAGFEQDIRRRTISDAVRKAASGLQGFQPTAIEDAIMYAEHMFDVDDTGKVSAKDGVGITPGISPEAWLRDTQQTKSHWWATSQGGGAAGGRTSGSKIANPWLPETYNLTEQGRLYRENPELAKQLAKAAGNEIG